MRDGCACFPRPWDDCTTVIVCLGDLLLDVIVRLDEPLSPGADAIAVTHAGAGGQAEDVAARAASLGSAARFVGERADAAAEREVGWTLRWRGGVVVRPMVCYCVGALW